MSMSKHTEHKPVFSDGAVKFRACDEEHAAGFRVLRKVEGALKPFMDPRNPIPLPSHEGYSMSKGHCAFCFANQQH